MYAILPEFNNGLDGVIQSPYHRGYKVKTWGLKDWCEYLNRKHPESKFAPTKGKDGLWYVGKLINNENMEEGK